MCHFWAARAANLHFAGHDAQQRAISGHDAQNRAGHAQALPGTPLMPTELSFEALESQKGFQNGF